MLIHVGMSCIQTGSTLRGTMFCFLVTLNTDYKNIPAPLFFFPPSHLVNAVFISAESHLTILIAKGNSYNV